MKNEIAADLILREAKVDNSRTGIPEGKKLMVVIGTALVDEEACVDQTRFLAFGRLKSDALKLASLCPAKVHPTYSAWDANSLYREFPWKFARPEDTRSLKAIRPVDDALAKIASDDGFTKEEADAVIKALNKLLKTLPTVDVMRSVIHSVIRSIEEN